MCCGLCCGSVGCFGWASMVVGFHGMMVCRALSVIVVASTNCFRINCRRLYVNACSNAGTDAAAEIRLLRHLSQRWERQLIIQIVERVASLSVLFVFLKRLVFLRSCRFWRIKLCVGRVPDVDKECQPEWFNGSPVRQSY